MKTRSGAARLRPRAAPLLLAAALAALAPAAARACGACAEDKIAATYDHAVVERARVHDDVVVYCELIGPFDEARLRRAARRIAGIEPRSIRVSAQPAAVSFAVDPRVRSPQAAVAALGRRVAPGAHLTIVRLVPVKALAAR